SYDRLNMKAESRFYMQAVGDDYPLNYYAVVAPHRAGLDGAKDWKDIFGDVDALREKLASSALDMSDIKKTPPLQRAWTRAQTLVSARITEMARLAVRDLQSELNERLLVKTSPDAFIALTRLQYQVGLYLQAISLTTTLEEATPEFW